MRRTILTIILFCILTVVVAVVVSNQVTALNFTLPTCGPVNSEYVLNVNNEDYSSYENVILPPLNDAGKPCQVRLFNTKVRRFVFSGEIIGGSVHVENVTCVTPPTDQECVPAGGGVDYCKECFLFQNNIKNMIVTSENNNNNKISSGIYFNNVSRKNIHRKNLTFSSSTNMYLVTFQKDIVIENILAGPSFTDYVHSQELGEHKISIPYRSLRYHRKRKFVNFFGSSGGEENYDNNNGGIIFENCVLEATISSTSVFTTVYLIDARSFFRNVSFFVVKSSSVNVVYDNSYMNYAVLVLYLARGWRDCGILLIENSTLSVNATRALDSKSPFFQSNDHQIVLKMGTTSELEVSSYSAEDLDSRNISAIILRNIHHFTVVRRVAGAGQYSYLLRQQNSNIFLCRYLEISNSISYVFVTIPTHRFSSPGVSSTTTTLQPSSSSKLQLGLGNFMRLGKKFFNNSLILLENLTTKIQIRSEVPFLSLLEENENNNNFVENNLLIAKNWNELTSSSNYQPNEVNYQLFSTTATFGGIEANYYTNISDTKILLDTATEGEFMFPTLKQFQSSSTKNKMFMQDFGSLLFFSNNNDNNNNNLESIPFFETLRDVFLLGGDDSSSSNSELKTSNIFSDRKVLSSTLKNSDISLTSVIFAAYQRQAFVKILNNLVYVNNNATLDNGCELATLRSLKQLQPPRVIRYLPQYNNNNKGIFFVLLEKNAVIVGMNTTDNGITQIFIGHFSLQFLRVNLKFTDNIIEFRGMNRVLVQIMLSISVFAKGIVFVAEFEYFNNRMQFCVPGECYSSSSFGNNINNNVFQQQQIFEENPLLLDFYSTTTISSSRQQDLLLSVVSSSNIICLAYVIGIAYEVELLNVSNNIIKFSPFAGVTDDVLSSSPTTSTTTTNAAIYVVLFYITDKLRGDQKIFSPMTILDPGTKFCVAAFQNNVINLTVDRTNKFIFDLVRISQVDRLESFLMKKNQIFISLPKQFPKQFVTFVENSLLSSSSSSNKQIINFLNKSKIESASDIHLPYLSIQMALIRITQYVNQIRKIFLMESNSIVADFSTNFPKPLLEFAGTSEECRQVFFGRSTFQSFFMRLLETQAIASVFDSIKISGNIVKSFVVKVEEEINSVLFKAQLQKNANFEFSKNYAELSSFPSSSPQQLQQQSETREKKLYFFQHSLIEGFVENSLVYIPFSSEDKYFLFSNNKLKCSNLRVASNVVGSFQIYIFGFGNFSDFNQLEILQTTIQVSNLIINSDSESFINPMMTNKISLLKKASTTFFSLNFHNFQENILIDGVDFVTNNISFSTLLHISVITSDVFFLKQAQKVRTTPINSNNNNENNNGGGGILTIRNVKGDVRDIRGNQYLYYSEFSSSSSTSTTKKRLAASHLLFLFAVFHPTSSTFLMENIVVSLSISGEHIDNSTAALLLFSNQYEMLDKMSPTSLFEENRQNWILIRNSLFNCTTITSSSSSSSSLIEKLQQQRFNYAFIAMPNLIIEPYSEKSNNFQKLDFSSIQVKNVLMHVYVDTNDGGNNTNPVKITAKLFTIEESLIVIPELLVADSKLEFFPFSSSTSDSNNNNNNFPSTTSTSTSTSSLSSKQISVQFLSFAEDPKTEIEIKTTKKHLQKFLNCSVFRQILLRNCSVEIVLSSSSSSSSSSHKNNIFSQFEGSLFSLKTPRLRTTKQIVIEKCKFLEIDANQNNNDLLCQPGNCSLIRIENFEGILLVSSSERRDSIDVDSDDGGGKKRIQTIQFAVVNCNITGGRRRNNNNNMFLSMSFLSAYSNSLKYFLSSSQQQQQNNDDDNDGALKFSLSQNRFLPTPESFSSKIFVPLFNYSQQQQQQQQQEHENNNNNIVSQSFAEVHSKIYSKFNFHQTIFDIKCNFWRRKTNLNFTNQIEQQQFFYTSNNSLSTTTTTATVRNFCKESLTTTKSFTKTFPTKSISKLSATFSELESSSNSKSNSAATKTFSLMKTNSHSLSKGTDTISNSQKTKSKSKTETVPPTQTYIDSETKTLQRTITKTSPEESFTKSDIISLSKNTNSKEFSSTSTISLIPTRKIKRESNLVSAAIIMTEVSTVGSAILVNVQGFVGVSASFSSLTSGIRAMQFQKTLRKIASDKCSSEEEKQRQQNQDNEFTSSEEEDDENERPPITTNILQMKLMNSWLLGNVVFDFAFLLLICAFFVGVYMLQWTREHCGGVGEEQEERSDSDSDSSTSEERKQQNFFFPSFSKILVESGALTVCLAATLIFFDPILSSAISLLFVKNEKSSKQQNQPPIYLRVIIFLIVILFFVFPILRILYLKFYNRNRIERFHNYPQRKSLQEIIQTGDDENIIKKNFSKSKFLEEEEKEQEQEQNSKTEKRKNRNKKKKKNQSGEDENEEDIYGTEININDFLLEEENQEEEVEGKHQKSENENENNNNNNNKMSLWKAQIIYWLYPRGDYIVSNSLVEEASGEMKKHSSSSKRKEQKKSSNKHHHHHHQSKSRTTTTKKVKELKKDFPFMKILLESYTPTFYHGKFLVIDFLLFFGFALANLLSEVLEPKKACLASLLTTMISLLMYFILTLKYYPVFIERYQSYSIPVLSFIQLVGYICALVGLLLLFAVLEEISNPDSAAENSDYLKRRAKILQARDRAMIIAEIFMMIVGVLQLLHAAITFTGAAMEKYDELMKKRRQKQKQENEEEEERVENNNIGQQQEEEEMKSRNAFITNNNKNPKKEGMELLNVSLLSSPKENQDDATNFPFSSSSATTKTNKSSRNSRGKRKLRKNNNSASAAAAAAVSGNRRRKEEQHQENEENEEEGEMLLMDDDDGSPIDYGEEIAGNELRRLVLDDDE